MTMKKPVFTLAIGHRWNCWEVYLVPLEGLEPPLLSEADFESAASTIPPQGPKLLFAVLLALLYTGKPCAVNPKAL